MISFHQVKSKLTQIEQKMQTVSYDNSLNESKQIHACR